MALGASLADGVLESELRQRDVILEHVLVKPDCRRKYRDFRQYSARWTQPIDVASNPSAN